MIETWQIASSSVKKFAVAILAPNHSLAANDAGTLKRRNAKTDFRHSPVSVNSAANRRPAGYSQSPSQHAGCLGYYSMLVHHVVDLSNRANYAAVCCSSPRL